MRSFKALIEKQQTRSETLDRVPDAQPMLKRDTHEMALTLGPNLDLTNDAC